MPGSDPTKQRTLKTLIQAGLVEEQRSGKTRRLKLTAKGRTVALKVREIEEILQGK